MKYLGSKRKISRYIIPLMVHRRKQGQYFYDLFAGGFNLIDKITGNRVANDINLYLIALFKKLQKENDTSFLPFIDEDEYKNISKNKNLYPDWLVGYVGFCLSFGGKFFAGYRRDKAGIRNYQNEAQQNLKAQQNLIKNIELFNVDYKEVPLKANSIIYCDPPYKNTTQYTNSFNHDDFYEFVLKKESQGHDVFISEYYMPEDYFESIWDKGINLTVDVNRKKTVSEKLWVLKGKNTTKQLNLF